MSALLTMLMLHEGLRLKMYTDTEGVPTIGYGHNLRDKPISQEVAELILDDDIQDAIYDCMRAWPSWFDDLDQVRQDVLVMMVFNIGIGGVKKFRKMIAAIKVADWDRAAKEMLDSTWARQVGKRANTLAQMMRTGKVNLKEIHKHDSKS